MAVIAESQRLKNVNSRYCCTPHHPFLWPLGSMTERHKVFTQNWKQPPEQLWHSEAYHSKTELSEALPSYQIFKLHVQVLADGELGVWYGFVKISVEIMEHLSNRVRWKVAYKGKPSSVGSDLYSLAWWSWEAEYRISQCYGEHRQIWQKLHWLLPVALARR